MLSTVDGGLTIIIHDRSPEGSVTQLHECSVLWKTPLFSERKYTLLGSKVAGQEGWGERRPIGESVQYSHASALQDVNSL